MVERGETKIRAGASLVSTVLCLVTVFRFLQQPGMEKDAALNHSRERRSPSTATWKVRLLLLVLQGVLSLAYSSVGFVLGGLKALGKQRKSEKDEGFVMGVKPAYIA
jgi:hypothetical protein